MDAGRRNNQESRMNNKYNVGDVVRIDCYASEKRDGVYMPVMLANKVAVITQKKLSFNLEHYRVYDVIVCGKENKVYEVQEKDIVEKL